MNRSALPCAVLLLVFLACAVPAAMGDPILIGPTPVGPMLGGADRVMASTSGPQGSELGEYESVSGNRPLTAKAGHAAVAGPNVIWQAEYEVRPYWYTAMGQITSDGSLHANSGVSAKGESDDKTFRAKSSASHTMLFTLSSSSTTTSRAVVRVNLAYDGDLYATSDANTYARAEASMWATATYSDGGIESQPLGALGGDAFVYRDGDHMEGNCGWMQHKMDDTTASGTSTHVETGHSVNDSGILEFEVDDLSRPVVLYISLETETYVEGLLPNKLFDGGAHAEFDNTATFSILSVTDPDNPGAVVTMTVIPEPASLCLLACGIVAMSLKRNRRRAT